MSEGNMLTLPDGLGHEGFLMEWADTVLSDRAASQMSKLDRAVVALRAIERVLEADELLTEKDNQGTFTYYPIPEGVRWGLRCSRTVVFEELERQLRLFTATVTNERKILPA